ncbi:hypothetical protein MPDQ_003009 [Monascus purpureus]|uniref:Signal recognition particle subunit SRP68 n=1 Tax=Monascus purpureus TaxID=5098 RepID=A0A507R3E8_MONPU|nr:hypothetical protein MPDQ_003009 [Monascus purpureus]BDD59424.1 hypothetical protein MAP00_004631 [Monascus purpureus]
MDITEFIFSQREEVLLVGDYNAYRAHASRRLLKLRRKLGQTTPKGRKYAAKSPVSAEDIASNAGFAHLLLLCSERAWAHAMHMKSTHAADPSAKGIVGSARRHIISRLNKAIGYARQLLDTLQDQSTSGASDTDLLEARAYLASLSGALWLEKRRWEECLQDYSVARVVYTVLGHKIKTDTFRELLSGTVDPSLRYAAYQLKLPRSKALPALAVEYFPSDAELRSKIESVCPGCLVEEASGANRTVDGQVPETVTWRSRTVPLEDASIAVAIASTSTAESHLASWLAEPAGKSASAKDKAAAYDSVISASQDAVDATKSAIDDLVGEGVDSGDKRMQSLQVTRTAVHYTLVGWRVGRNRILCGDQDGVYFEEERTKVTKRGEPNGKKLTRLREKVALYDSTLQSVELILELPGVAGDTSFVQELEGKRSYFRALRCLAIGRSHGILGKSKNALALYSRALELAAASVRSSADVEGPLKLEVSRQQVQTLENVLQGLVATYQGLVTLEMLSAEEAAKATNQSSFIERLHEFSGDRLDLGSLVPYPPQMKPIPVKPLFLDVAWNYIDYPRAGEPRGTPEKPTEEKKGGRRGWFGFGR